MRVADIEYLYDYNYWANQKLFAVILQLSPDEYTQTVAGSYESIRNTLVHMLSAEWGWLDRCGGLARGDRLDPRDFPTLDVVTKAWREVETAMHEFLSGLTDDAVARDVTFAIAGQSHSIPLGGLLHHAAIHGAHHRGQVALMLRTLGYTPGNFDLLIYMIAMQSHTPNRAL